MKKLLINYGLAVGAISTVLYVLFVMTNPDNLPAAVFITVFILLYGLIVSVLIVAGLVAKRLEMLSWPHLRIQKTAALIGVLPIFLLILQSIGLLTLRDILLAVGLCMLLFVYFTRLSGAQNKQ